MNPREQISGRWGGPRAYSWCSALRKLASNEQVVCEVGSTSSPEAFKQRLVGCREGQPIPRESRGQC